MFNNCNSKTNGEERFFCSITPKLNVIFDVGCKFNSEFIIFPGEVHYFDPNEEYIKKLSEKTNNNRISYFNNFGLGKENKELFYYPKYESFFDRVNSCRISDDDNKVMLTIKTAKEYIIEKNITNIDFLKIDTEGFDLDVLQGFGDLLNIVKIIQFEYGGTALDNNITLIDMIGYLSSKGFYNFSYLIGYGFEPVVDFENHCQYCNIICKNIKSDIAF